MTLLLGDAFFFQIFLHFNLCSSLKRRCIYFSSSGRGFLGIGDYVFRLVIFYFMGEDFNLNPHSLPSNHLQFK